MEIKIGSISEKRLIIFACTLVFLLLGLCFFVSGSTPNDLPKLPMNSISVEDILAGKSVYFVLVKDFMRIENSGERIGNVFFKRYFPVIDQEQIVAARWVDAKSDSTGNLPVYIQDVEPDSDGNLVHTYRLPVFPEKDQILVTVTSLVVRKERPIPERSFQIPNPEAYPEDVRVFLQETKIVPCNHPEVKDQAEKLLLKTKDAYQLAVELAGLMKSKPYDGFKKWDRSVPVAVNVLRHGGSCCSSANSACAVLRACGIPAQATYTPAGYFHGIVQFYLEGHGWVRMDSTCGRGDIPLIKSERGLGLIKIFDMPIEMEEVQGSFAWPYYNTDEKGAYRFISQGKMNPNIFFARKIKKVEKPYVHYESGSWSKVLGSETVDGAWFSWESFINASRKDVQKKKRGEFRSILKKIPEISKYIKAAHSFDF